MWHSNNGLFWGMHFLWWIFWIVLVMWILFGSRRIYGGGKKRENDMDILKKRFAKGEIDKNEFEEKKRILEEDQ